MLDFNPAVTALRDQAEAEFRLIATECTEMGLKIMAKKARHFCIQLENVPSPAALILKQTMLSISGIA